MTVTEAAPQQAKHSRFLGMIRELRAEGPIDVEAVLEGVPSSAREQLLRYQTGQSDIISGEAQMSLSSATDPNWNFGDIVDHLGEVGHELAAYDSGTTEEPHELSGEAMHHLEMMTSPEVNDLMYESKMIVDYKGGEMHSFLPGQPIPLIPSITSYVLGYIVERK